MGNTIPFYADGSKGEALYYASSDSSCELSEGDVWALVGRLRKAGHVVAFPMMIFKPGQQEPVFGLVASKAPAGDLPY